MARNKFDTCMFCNELPCGCNKKPVKKVAKPRATKSTPASAATPIAAEPKRAVAPIKVASPPKKSVANAGTRPNHSGIQRVKSDEEQELGRAITVLADAGLLHRDELVKHRRLIELPAWRVDALIWRQDIA